MSTRGGERSESFIDAGGVRLRALCEGAGSPVVLLHGFTGAAESLEGAALALRARHRVVRVDLVGHGASDAPHDSSRYSMAACVSQLERVCAALAIPAAHWLGYSMGGRTALALAAAHPERVRSLLLIGASAGLRDRAERSTRARGDEALADAIERDGIETFTHYWMSLPLFASQAQLGAQWLEAARAQRLRNRPHGLANSLRGMGAGAQPPLHEALAELRMPACFVAGAADAKFRAIAAELAALAPHGEARTLAHAGHAAHLEAPEAFAALALEFFAAVETKQLASARAT